MKTLLVAAVAALSITTVQAGTMNCNTFGAMQTCNGPNGYNATENTFGNMTTGRDSLGNSWTTNQFGGQMTTTFQPGYHQRGW
jgi:hypothetical protein